MGVRVIVLYKLAKAGVQLALAAILLLLLLAGLTAELHELAARLVAHAASAWSAALARALVRATTRGGVHVALAALLADAGLSFLEGWCLHRRLWWAPWLIVVLTGALLPFELFELLRRPHVGRALLFAANLTIVGYLARRASHERRRRKELEAGRGR